LNLVATSNWALNLFTSIYICRALCSCRRAESFRFWSFSDFGISDEGYSTCSCIGTSSKILPKKSMLVPYLTLANFLSIRISDICSYFQCFTSFMGVVLMHMRRKFSAIILNYLINVAMSNTVVRQNERLSVLSLESLKGNALV
jgi:hypothetical protein